MFETLRGQIAARTKGLLSKLVAKVATPRRSQMSVALLTGSLLFVGLMGSAFTPMANAAGSLRFVRGYSVQGSWLCYGFSNGAFHCTQHWRVVNGRYVSYNSPFVPSQGSVVTTAARSSTPAPVVSSNTNVYTSRFDGIEYCGSQRVDFSNASAWAKPHGCYGLIFRPRSTLGRPSFGWCNWAAEASHLNYGGRSVLGLAKHYGAPRVGAVVWFSGFDQGASADGHWANLVAIGPHGWGLIEEMNFSYRGGGFGRIDFRFIHLYQRGTAYLYA